MIKNDLNEKRDVSGSYIILLLAIFGVLPEFFKENAFSEMIGFNLSNLIINIGYIFPIVVLILFIQKKKQIDDKKKIFFSLVIFCLIATFLPMTVGNGLFQVILAFGLVLIFFIISKIRKKNYLRPFLYTCVISTFLYILTFQYIV